MTAPRTASILPVKYFVFISNKDWGSRRKIHHKAIAAPLCRGCENKWKNHKIFLAYANLTPPRHLDMQPLAFT